MGLGLAAAGAAAVLVSGLHAAYPKDSFLFLDVPAVGAVAYAFGAVPGFTAGVVALLTAWYFIIPPAGWALTPDTVPILVLFAAGLFGTVEGGLRLRAAQAAAQQMALVVGSADDAIISEALDGTIQTWNVGAERLYGYAASEAVGWPATLLVVPDRVGEIWEWRDLVRRGAPTQRYESSHVRKDGSPIDVSVTVSPVRDAGGRVIGTSAVVRDISERRRAQRYQQFLVDAGEILSASFDLQRTLETLAALAVPTFADLCMVDLLGDDGRVRRLVVTHRDPAKHALAQELRDTYPADPAARRLGSEVIRTARSLHISDIEQARIMELVPDARARALLAELGWRSMVVVPLTARNRVFGALTFVTAESGRRYDAHDVAFAEDLAHRVAVAVDNARLHEAEQTQRQAVERLQAITAGLSKAVTQADVAGVVLDEALSAIGANAGFVSKVSPDGTTLDAIADRGFDETLSRRWQQIDITTIASPVREVARTGVPLFLESLEAAAASFEGVAAARSELPPGARAVLPLQAAGTTFGVMLLLFPTRLEFSQRDRALLDAIARQCAQALDRARLDEREHDAAKTLQEALLPPAPPVVPGLRVSARYAPASPGAEVGGDWYDAFRLPDGRLALAIGDVVGHGIKSAVVMGQVRHSIRAAALEHRDPAAVLAVASEVLRLSHAEEGMTTAVFGVLDPIALTFTYAAAAHPAPIVVAPDGPRQLAVGGLPLGFFDAAPAPSWTVDIPRGSLLVLYTDGLVELSRDVVAGHAALLAALEAEFADLSSDPAARILDRVVGGRAAPDDIAIVTVAIDAAPLDRLNLVLPAALSSLRPVRHAVHQLAQSVGVDAQRASALLIATGEAVNNAIEHAYGAVPGKIYVRARRDGDMLRVEIEDQGRWRPERPANHGGRGITLMRGLVDSMEITTSARGTLVVLAVALPNAGGAPARAGSPAVAASFPPPGGWPVRERLDDRARAEIETQHGAPVITLDGDLDQLNVDRFTTMLERVAADSPALVVLSLNAVSYLDSRGVQALLRMERRLHSRRCRLAVAAAPESPARRLLDACGVSGLLRVSDSVEAAALDAAAADER